MDEIAISAWISNDHREKTIEQTAYSPLLRLSRGKVHRREFGGQADTAESAPAGKSISRFVRRLCCPAVYVYLVLHVAVYLCGKALLYVYNPASYLSLCSECSVFPYLYLRVLHGQYLHRFCLLLNKHSLVVRGQYLSVTQIMDLLSHEYFSPPSLQANAKDWWKINKHSEVVYYVYFLSQKELQLSPAILLHMLIMYIFPFSKDYIQPSWLSSSLLHSSSPLPSADNLPHKLLS